jgi:hypothetical protein
LVEVAKNNTNKIKCGSAGDGSSSQLDLKL